MGLQQAAFLQQSTIIGACPARRIVYRCHGAKRSRQQVRVLASDKALIERATEAVELAHATGYAHSSRDDLEHRSFHEDLPLTVPDSVVGVLQALEEFELMAEVAEHVIDPEHNTDMEVAVAAIPHTPNQWMKFWDVRKWSRRARGLVLFNCIVPLCASNWILLKLTEKLIDPSTFSLLRFSVSALAFAPFLGQVTPQIRRAGLEVGFWAGIGYLAQAEGLLYADASRSSFLGALTVIVVPLLCGLTGRGVKPVTWASAAIAFLGMGLLEGGGAQGADLRGDAYNIISALAFGVQMFRTEQFSRSLPEGSNLPLMATSLSTIAAMSFALTASTHVPETQALLQHPWAVWPVIAGLSWKQIATILYTGILSTDGVLLIEVTALQDIPSTDGAIIYTLIPVMGGAFAWYFLDERWGLPGWIGAALIIGSSIVAQKFGMDSEESKEHTA